MFWFEAFALIYAVICFLFTYKEHERLNQELVVAQQRKEVEKEKLLQMLTEGEALYDQWPVL